eukprot:12429221-Karenia_brevis.AAC.1
MAQAGTQGQSGGPEGRRAGEPEGRKAGGPDARRLKGRRAGGPEDRRAGYAWLRLGHAELCLAMSGYAWL